MDPTTTLDSLPRLRLCQLPTPIQRLARLEVELGVEGGPELHVKRDDLTGLGFGGNKGRKLEFSLAEAQVQGADTVLTCGGVQSNHCRQTAAAARALGFGVHLFLSGKRPDRFTGNLLPSELCGAEFHFVNADDTVDLEGRMGKFAGQLRAQGRRPYPIPIGASNPTGAMGYVNAAREIRTQEEELGFAFDRIVITSGSGGTRSGDFAVRQAFLSGLVSCCPHVSAFPGGKVPHGTQAGLLVGKRLFGLQAKVVGMGVHHPKSIGQLREAFARLATDTGRRLGIDEVISPEEMIFVPDYVGPDYGVPTEESKAAIRLLARLEGIFLGPTYTAKAMAGLIDYVKQGKFEARERVLFIHTGGTIELFA